MHLKNWTAKRAGGRITVYGTNAEGKPDKIVGVDDIKPGKGPFGPQVIATDKHGATHILEL